MRVSFFSRSFVKNLWSTRFIRRVYSILAEPLSHLKLSWPSCGEKFSSSTNTIPTRHPNSVYVSSSDRKLVVNWDVQDVSSSYHSHWLAHHCQCTQCVDPSSGQKISRSSSFQPDYKIKEAQLSSDRRTLEVKMKGDSSHVYAIPTDFLYRNAYNPVLVDDTIRNPPPLTVPVPSVNYSDIVSGDKGLHSWLSLLAERGLVLVKDVPTELGMVVRVSELVAPVQETSYGRMFDVLSTDNAINIAYTPSELEPHMDLTYYESPPGLQLLHCVRFDPCVSGGESTFVDGFEVARKFKETDPEDFKILSSVPVTFQKVHYRRDRPAHLIYSKPHITTNTAGDIIEFSWAPPFEGPLRVHPDLVEPYYKAYRKFAEVVNSSDLLIEFRLQPGELVSFNNRRILHGRRGFSLNGGVRHIQGAYVNIDEFNSKYHYQSVKIGRHHTKFHVGNRNI